MFCTNNKFWFNVRTSASYEQDSKVQFVIDAVYAFAYALQNMKQVISFVLSFKWNASLYILPRSAHWLTDSLTDILQFNWQTLHNSWRNNYF